MKDELFNINNFNIVQDEENYYFFRALNIADNTDLEQGTTISKNGEIERVRTDRERYEGTPKYNETSELSLKEVYDHIKMHYRKDTNCISLTSNANIAINYGRGSYRDKYIMVKIPKKELGEKTIVAGQYMLKELYSIMQQTIEKLDAEQKQRILEIFSEIDNVKEKKSLDNIIKQRYTTINETLNPNKAHLRNGIIYRAPRSRISSYQALNEEQLLELNKVYAKLAILENEQILKHVIPHSSNSKLRETIGNAFSSTEVIHYGDIKQEEIIEVPKEIVDIFSLIQQIEDIDKNRIEELKKALIFSVQEGLKISSIEEITAQPKDNISIEEMYELTEGKVPYWRANSIVKNMFYLSKSRQNAIRLSNLLRDILGDDVRFQDIIEHIGENGFRIEPEIISRQSNKGVKLSESVNLNLQKEEQTLVDEIKKLSSEELEQVLQNGGLYNAKGIITKTFGSVREKEKIDKSRYYAEAIIAKYNWQEIGIERFRIEERNELIKRLQEKDCLEIYQRLKQIGIKENQIPVILLNIITREGFYDQYKQGNLEQLLNTRKDILLDNINVELVEKFLGYYDVEDTHIQLKDYQQRAFNNVNKIFEDKKFAQVILPTGAGKSFVALAQMLKYASEHKNEKILYLAPQAEILNQMKKYIIKYIHGKQRTVGRSEEEIIKETFTNITFETYSGLLAKRGQEIIKDQYGMIVLDELHRTGAKEWEGKIDTLFENQNDNVKVLGVTATPERDVDGRDMAEENAKKLGYTEEEIKQRKHIASNITLESAIRMGYVVNPKIVYCKYDLISSGNLEKLKSKIDDIEDESKRAEELQKFNELRTRINKEIDGEIGEEERKKLEEDARRNLDNGLGKEEILRQYVKKGGKYIVFIPVSDQGDIEDEDGNRIGTKTGEDKIKAYNDYLNKVFEGTDIVPQYHAMIGSWNNKEKNKNGEDKNQQELDEFESDNSEETKFMMVMNKANEGIHINGVDGIIWFRALDENSRILYLQQLGRIIYALDEEKPITEEKRPIVIDLANNSLTVKMEKNFEKSKSIDDLEELLIVIEWINLHNGMLPERDSSSRKEQHFYNVLRRIQSKYSKYLEGFDDFEDLPKEEKTMINEIIEFSSEIDLWDIDLPPISKTKFTKEFNPFLLEGVLKDFVEFEDEVNGIEKETSVSKLLNIIEILKDNGIEPSKLPHNTKLLKDIKIRTEDGQIIDIEKIIQETGLDGKYNIGSQISNALQAAKGRRGYTLTKEQVEKLIEYGLITRQEIEVAKSGIEKETAVSKLLSIIEILKNNGIEPSKLPHGKKLLKDIKIRTENGQIIDIEKIIQETGIDGKYNIGSQIASALRAAKGRGTSKITEEQVEKLIEYGLITRQEIEVAKSGIEKETAVSKLLSIIEILKNNGIEPSKLPHASKLLKDIKIRTENGQIIDIEKIIQETGLDGKYNIGAQIVYALQAAKGRGTYTITKEQVEKLIEYGLITRQEIEDAKSGIEKETSASKLLSIIEILKNNGIEPSKLPHASKLLKDIKIRTENGQIIDIEKIIQETGIDGKYNIGLKIASALRAAKGRGKSKITEEQVEKLIEYGIITREKLEKSRKFNHAKKRRDEAKNKNNEVRKLEQQVSEQLDKRLQGSYHE